MRHLMLPRRALLRCGLAAASLGLGTAAAARAPRVVFLNPGEPVERGTGPYWRMVSRFMEMAAASLGFTLEIVYAERDHLLMLRQAQQLGERGDAPDYVVIVNEKSTAPQMLELLDRSSAKVMVIHNDVTAEQRRETGDERQRYPRWIGSAVPDNPLSGWRLMEELYRQTPEREPLVIGITGDPLTPVSQERAQGVADYIAHAARGRALQLVHGDWSYADGERKGEVLLARYPDAHVLWAANDSMALGALRAVRARYARVRVGGMGGWPEALTSIAEGGLAATAAGHYLIGAWALVLLHDYHHGLDFAAAGGPAQKLDFLYVVARENVARYDRALFRDAAPIDFRTFSKVASRRGSYDFRIDALVRNTRTG